MADDRLRVLSHLDSRPDEVDISRLRNALESAVGAVFRPGHRVTVLRNGDETFPGLGNQPTMTHAKAVLVDGVLSIVGSLNIDRRSVEKDEETAVEILDGDITSELERHFQEDVARSEPASREDANGGRRLFAKLLKSTSPEI